MIDDVHAWAGGRLALACAATANASGWIVSLVSENVSIGAVVTFCTVAVPAVVGAVIYTVQKVSPVIFQFIKDRDAARSSTLSGQMERLNRNLEDAVRRAETSDRLADTASKQADRLGAMLEASDAHVKELLDAVRAGNARVEDANRKLHELAKVANRDSLRAAEAEMELAEIRAKYGVLSDVLAPQVAQNTSRIAETSIKVEKIAHAGLDLATGLAEVGNPPAPAAGPDLTKGDGP